MDIFEDMPLCPFPKRDPELGDNGIHGEADYPQTKRLRLDEHLVNTSSSNSGTASPCGSSGMEYHHHALQQAHCRGQLPLPYTQATRECTCAIDYMEKTTTSHSGDRASFSLFPTPPSFLRQSLTMQEKNFQDRKCFNIISYLHTHVKYLPCKTAISMTRICKGFKGMRQIV